MIQRKLAIKGSYGVFWNIQKMYFTKTLDTLFLDLFSIPLGVNKFLKMPHFAHLQKLYFFTQKFTHTIFTIRQ